MACLSLPIPTPPPLPLPFTVTPPPLPPIPTIDADLCCKLPLPIPPIPPIPLPPIVISSPTWTAILLALNTALLTIQSYIDALPLDCPRD